MKTKLFVVVVLLLFVTTGVYAQHERHQKQKDTTRTTEMDHRKMNHGLDSSQMPPMSHAYSLNLPMNRNGSGTGWLPDASPMYGYMLHSKKWMYMIHGNIFVRYNNQDIGNKGTRGDTKVNEDNFCTHMLRARALTL
jgi:hypothetical protein